MSVFVIATDDAKTVANKLRTSLQSNVAHIRQLSPNEFIKSEQRQSDRSVRVIFLTALLWQEIQRQTKEDICKLFSEPLNTIVLVTCSEHIKESAVGLFSKTIKNWEAVGLFTASGEDWFHAEARIRYRLMEIENGEVTIPCASRYIIKPDSVSTVTESQSEVIVILFNDAITEHSEVKRLEVKYDGNVIQARKIQSNIWSFNAFDFTPGEHEIRVLADDVDIGPYTIHIRDQDADRKELLTSLKKQDPKRFIAELLKIDENDFDYDLLDKISGLSCVSLVEVLLKYGEENGYDYPNFLHLCAKHGLQASARWFLNRLPETQLKEVCKVRNNDGKTPHQVAVETNQNQGLIAALEVKEDLEILESPFKKVNRDSGRSSQGSGESLADVRHNMNEAEREPAPDPTAESESELVHMQQKGFGKKRFEFKRAPHHYNTIHDDDVKASEESKYNSPWDSKPLPAFRRAQSLSAGSLSGSRQENVKGKKNKLVRANTTGGSSTRM